MTTVTVYTAERMQEIEDQAVIGASIVDGHVIFERFNGATFDGGAIDVTVIGNLTLNVDEETYYRYTDAGTPQAIVADTEASLNGTLMDADDGEPAWGHWETGGDDSFVIDVTGFYDVSVTAVSSNVAADAGRTFLKIAGDGYSAFNEYKHEDTTDPRLYAQYTTMYQAGEAVRGIVESTENGNVDTAELFIRKFNITMDGSAEAGGLSYSRNPDVYIRQNDVGPSQSLTAGVTEQIFDTFLDEDVNGEPSWGHWADDNYQFAFDTAGMYETHATFDLDSSGGAGTGFAQIWFAGTNVSSKILAIHEAGIDTRLEVNMVSLFEPEDVLNINVRCTEGYDIDSGSIYIRKYDLG